MKRLVLACLVATSVTGCIPKMYSIPVENGKLAGILPMRDGRVRYEFSEQVPGVPAKEVFSRIRRWMALHVKDPSVTIAQSDHNNLELIVPVELESALIDFTEDKHYIVYTSPSELALIVRAKDGGFDATLGNFRKVNDPAHAIFYNKDITRPIEAPTVAYPKMYQEDFKRIDGQVKRLVENLKIIASRNN